MYKHIAARLSQIGFIVYAASFCQHAYSQYAFNVPTTKSSFFTRDDQGIIKLNNEGLPYQSQKETMTINVNFTTANTAFFVMDPWDDMPSDFLNHYYGKITQHYILPLINRANTKGFPVYVFSNDCTAIKPTPYSCHIPKQFNAMTKTFSNMHILYWQNLNLATFAQSLKDKGITNIIYTGFASNMCIINRPTGMMNMVELGFSLYFIPEASAATELQKTWQSQEIHKATTIIISQWMAKLIKYTDIYAKLA